ncbi:MAG: hypothetical protein PHV59_04585, partial [Victivallales bacterium]|nr:hypothetical protein [Victivallales bacterium]
MRTDFFIFTFMFRFIRYLNSLLNCQTDFTLFLVGPSPPKPPPRLTTKLRFSGQAAAGQMPCTFLFWHMLVFYFVLRSFRVIPGSPGGAGHFPASRGMSRNLRSRPAGIELDLKIKLSICFRENKSLFFLESKDFFLSGSRCLSIEINSL